MQEAVLKMCIGVGGVFSQSYLLIAFGLVGVQEHAAEAVFLGYQLVF
jgi:hypothetical protein